MILVVRKKFDKATDNNWMFAEVFISKDGKTPFNDHTQVIVKGKPLKAVIEKYKRRGYGLLVINDKKEEYRNSMEIRSIMAKKLKGREKKIEKPSKNG